MRICAYVCLLAVVPCASTAVLADSDKGVQVAKDFVLKGEILEAFEGGPVVVRLTLSYAGTQPTEIPDAYHLGDDVISIDAPDSWEERPPRPRLLVVWPGPKRIRPNEEVSEVVYVHHRYTIIPPGKARLTLSWFVDKINPPQKVETDEPPVSWDAVQQRLKKPPQKVKKPPEPKEGRKENERNFPSVTLNVDILPATSERVRALAQALEQKLDSSKRPETDSRSHVCEVIDSLRYTNHPGLTPVAWRLIESYPDVSPVSHFLPMVYATSNDRSAVNRRLIKLTCNTRYPSLDDIFWYWRREKVPLSADELAPLLRSENVWTRALTYATFPNRCDREWSDQLFRGLRAAQQPLPENRFARLVAELDDDEFTVRERATLELQQHGEPVRAQLVKVLQGQPTPEVKSRVQRVLNEIAKDPPRIVRTTLWLLQVVHEPHAEAMLRLLADGEPNSWATKEAKTILARRQE